MKETESQNGPGLTAAVDILDADGESRARNLEQRSEPRHSLREECRVFLLNGDEPAATCVKGVARNLSFHGVSIVSGLAGSIQPGSPVEVVVGGYGEQCTHLAGTVAFCRQVDGACHELGIHVQAAGRGPILMHDVERARQMYSWFADSLCEAE